MNEVTPIFTRLNEPLVNDNSIKAAELYKISCDKTSIGNLIQANNYFKFYYNGDFP